MNWLMSSNPLVLAAWIIALIGAVLLTFGRRGKLVSRAEFCRKCGHETTSAGPRCTECGTRLGVSSMRLAFELNHPLLSRFGAVTRRGRRSPSTPLVAWGTLALLIGLGIGAGVPAMRLARVDWNRFRDTESLIAHIEKLRFDDPRHARIMGVLAARRDQGRLSTPQLAAHTRITAALNLFKTEQMLAQSRAAAAQPIYAAYVPPVLPRQAPAATSTARASQAEGIVGMIDSISSQLKQESREVVTYQPPPIATGYDQALATAFDQIPVQGLSGLSPRFEIVAGTALPDSSAYTPNAVPRAHFSPATGLAPRGGLTQRATMPFAGSPTLPPAFTAANQSFNNPLTPGVVRTSTLNNPVLAPSTYQNRPLSPSRISNAFGR